MLRKFVDVDGYEWLPCLDGSYVAVDGDGYMGTESLGNLKSYYGPLRLVEVSRRVRDADGDVWHESADGSWFDPVYGCWIDTYGALDRVFGPLTELGDQS